MKSPGSRMRREWAAIVLVVGLIVIMERTSWGFATSTMREREVSLGARTSLERENVRMAGVVGGAAVRADLPVHYLGILGEATYGLTKSLDMGLSLGAAKMKGPWEEAKADQATLMTGGLRVRGTAWSNHSVEVGFLGDVRYLPSVAFNEDLLVGNLRMPGQVALKNVFATELGTGVTFWLRTAGKTWVAPYVRGSLLPIVALSGTVQQGEFEAKSVSRLTAGPERLWGVATGLGINVNRFFITPEVRFWPIAGGIKLEILL